MSNEKTETAEVKKATPKSILTAIVNALTLKNVDTTILTETLGFGETLVADLLAFTESIKNTSVRGLPAAERLALVNDQINKHYDVMPADRTGDEFAKWQYESFQMLQRKGRIEREIKEGGASRGQGGKANNKK